MLIAVILRKLSSDVNSRMARDHYDSEWTPNTLLDSILKGIRIVIGSAKMGLIAFLNFQIQLFATHRVFSQLM